jgi:hypothetical protein
MSHSCHAYIYDSATLVLDKETNCMPNKYDGAYYTIHNSKLNSLQCTLTFKMREFLLVDFGFILSLIAVVRMFSKIGEL